MIYHQALEEDFFYLEVNSASFMSLDYVYDRDYYFDIVNNGNCYFIPVFCKANPRLRSHITLDLRWLQQNTKTQSIPTKIEMIMKFEIHGDK